MNKIVASIMTVAGVALTGVGAFNLIKDFKEDTYEEFDEIDEDTEADFGPIQQ